MIPAGLVTVSDLARRAKRPARRLRYQLLALEKRGGGWLLRTKGKFWVNELALQAAHPAFFEPMSLEARVADVEERIEIAERSDVDQARALGNMLDRVVALEKKSGPKRTKADQVLPPKVKGSRRRPESRQAPVDG